MADIIKAGVKIASKIKKGEEKDGDGDNSPTSPVTPSVTNAAPTPRAAPFAHPNTPEDRLRSPRQRVTRATAARARSRLAGGRRRAGRGSTRTPRRTGGAVNKQTSLRATCTAPQRVKENTKSTYTCNLPAAPPQLARVARPRSRCSATAGAAAATGGRAASAVPANFGPIRPATSRALLRARAAVRGTS